MDIIQATILSIIEGITEFLPISSTGHMILAESAMKMHNDAFKNSFTIAVQIGAILAIVMMYVRRFFQSITIYLKLAIAFLPTGILGLLAYPYIKKYLFDSEIGPKVASLSLILGGIVLVLIDKKVIRQQSKTAVLEDINYKNAFFIGLFQSISMIPGVSRAAATIVGGIFNGLDKKQAMEFSFLLAVPTMFAATAYDLYKTPIIFTHNDIFLLGVGLIIAFITAWIAVKVFLKIVQNYGFKYFGYYRIIIGIIFLLVIHGMSA